jgi:hypothetical protein
MVYASKEVILVAGAIFTLYLPHEATLDPKKYSDDWPLWHVGIKMVIDDDYEIMYLSLVI